MLVATKTDCVSKAITLQKDIGAVSESVAEGTIMEASPRVTTLTRYAILNASRTHM